MENREHAVRIAALALLIGASAAAEERGGAPQSRLVLQVEAAGTIRGEYRGETEIVVMPPFEPARVTLELDGHLVATLTSAPYRIAADLGPKPVEHSIRVTATAPDRRRVRWESIINRGSEPLSVRVVKRDDGMVEAIVTSPVEDPVVEVEFFHDVGSLGRLTSPPWLVRAPEVHDSLLHAVAITRSGIQDSHGLTPSAEVFIEEYAWRRVPIEVSVVNEEGNVLTNLEASQFRIIDNGERARIVSFAKAFDEPVSFSLLIDASNSMNSFMPHVQRAARRFLERTMRDGDRASVYSIHQVPRRWQPLTGDLAAVQSALGQIESRGNTALWDAVATSIRELEREPRRKAIVLLSDGEDTDSLTTWPEILKSARFAAIPIYIIAFGSKGTTGRHADQLRYLAAESGGFVVDATTESLELAWNRIEQDLRARYVIQYEVFASSKANQWRTIKVSVSSPRWTPRAIRGYFAR